MGEGCIAGGGGGRLGGGGFDTIEGGGLDWGDWTLKEKDSLIVWCSLLVAATCTA